jgi:ferredoxin
MTPFGIRNRLKKLVGMGKSDQSITTFPITFVLPGGTEQRVEAEERYTLLMASQTLPSPISTGRRAGGTCPDGGCGLCRVEVLDGRGLSPQTDLEKRVIEAHVNGEPHEGRERQPGPPATPSTRLGCHTRIVAPGARVQVLELFNYDSIKGDPHGT